MYYLILNSITETMKYYKIPSRLVWIFLAIVVLLMILCTFNSVNNLDGTNKIIETGSSEREAKINHRNTRLNVIILTHMSSGSTFVGNIFNLHPNVFYLLEPLRELRMSVYGDRDLGEWNVMEAQENDAYGVDVSNLLRGLFTCSFHGQGTVDKVFPGWIRKPKRFDYLAWRSFTMQFTEESINEACNSRVRRITVAKIMQTRLPGKIGIRELQCICSSEPNNFKCLIIHLVRDPRAVLSSLIQRQFFLPNGPKRNLIVTNNTTREGNNIISRNARILCSQVEENLRYVNAEWKNWFKTRYILVRYEDIVSDLVRSVQYMYNFTGLPLVPSIKNWIHKGEPPVRSRDDIFVISKDDVDRIDHWRVILNKSLLSVLEDVCGPLMKLMGYISIQNSSDRHVNDPKLKLWTEKIPFLERLRH